MSTSQSFTPQHNQMHAEYKYSACVCAPCAPCNARANGMLAIRSGRQPKWSRLPCEPLPFTQPARIMPARTAGVGCPRRPVSDHWLGASRTVENFGKILSKASASSAASASRHTENTCKVSVLFRSTFAAQISSRHNPVSQWRTVR